MIFEEALVLIIWAMVVVSIQAIIVLFLVWLLRKKQVWGLIMLALRGGSLIMKGYPDNTVEIFQSKKPLNQVKWTVMDRATGKKRAIYQPIKRVWHVLKGTPYPLHICPFNSPSNVSIMDRGSGLLTVEEINALMVKQYSQGASDATSFKTLAGFPIDKATLLMLFVVGILVVILIMINLQIMGALSPPA